MAQKIRGVNLGGWLVLERWIKPSLFRGLKAQDETEFCLELGERKTEKLQRHWQGFITEEDFKWVAEHGLNAVRIPVGHWIFGDVKPYVGALEYLDWSIKTAETHNLKVLIDIHTAPGSQNGWHHSGHIGEINWPKDQRNIERSLVAVERLAKRYAGRPNIFGIGLLNEPNGEIPKEILWSFYQSGYRRIRECFGSEGAVVISDAFRPEMWGDVMTEPDYSNVILDAHLYQCFSEKDVQLDIQGHLIKTKKEWGRQIQEVKKYRPVIIGEWSLGLAPNSFKNMDELGRHDARRAYAAAQVRAFEEADGWFFWTYKTQSKGGWNFRHCVETGLLPDNFASIK